MTGLQDFLSQWDGVFLLFILALFLLIFLFADSAGKMYEERAVFPSLMPYKRVILLYSLAVVALTALSVISLSSFICKRVFAKEEVGAFYEAKFYERDYEALLSLEGRPIFCIIRVRRDTEELGYETHIPDSIYDLINPVQLPYGVKRYAEESSFDSFERQFQVRFDREVSCTITLIRPVIYNSHKTLEDEILSTSGRFCGSKKSDTFHFYECSYARKIEKENFIYFDSIEEAHLFGYDMCDYCRNHYR